MQDEFEAAFATIRPPKTLTLPEGGPETEAAIVSGLQRLGITVTDYYLDPAGYHAYVTAAEYPQDYYSSNIVEKSLEHYIAATLLVLKPGDTYIDVASEHSPVPEIYERLFGVKAFRQDLAYKAGLHENRIGGDAARMPVRNDFADKMALHCSFEHFENDSDIQFIREIRRTLRPGGAVCFVPFYLSDRYFILTDPLVSAGNRVPFEPGVTVRGMRGWGNRFGRFYDPTHVHSRLWSNLQGLEAEVFRIHGAQDLDPSCYARYALVVRRPTALTTPTPKAPRLEMLRRSVRRLLSA